MKSFALALAGIVLGGIVLSGETLTLPAAASILGTSPFYSDVRAFNISYTTSLAVTATYRCFLPTSCVAGTPQIQFTLAPRESKAFDDMIASTFLAPNTAGGVEFTFDGPPEQLVVTSRLFSTAPTPTVGMFVPGLRSSQTYAAAVLTSIRHVPFGVEGGFRTNVGAFNPGDDPVSVVFTIFVDGASVGTPVARTALGHSGVQVNGIFETAGAAAISTQNGVVLVSASRPVFSYAAVIDNATSDPIFVVGAKDPGVRPTPTITLTPSITQTPTMTFTPSITPTASTTPTPSATATRTPILAPSITLTQLATRTPTPNPNHIVRVQNYRFVDQPTLTTTTTVHSGETVEWDWYDSVHSTTSGQCVFNGLCSPDGVWDSMVQNAGYKYTQTFFFDPSPTGKNTFQYYCSIHGSSMGMIGAVNVVP